MVVEVILSEVGKDTCRKTAGARALLVKSVGRNLHNRICAACLLHLVEQRKEQKRIGGSVFCRAGLTVNIGGDGAYHTDLFTQLPQGVTEYMSNCSFSVCTCHGNI